MEKYRKFDDPSCGLNPFTPLKPKYQYDPYLVYLRNLLSGIFFIIKIPCIIIVSIMMAICHSLKYILLIP